MKKIFEFLLNLRTFLPLFYFLLILILQIKVDSINALPMNNSQNDKITEELRLKIPSDFKKVWLDAEKKIWEPWLSIQDGFLGRQIFWNEDKEEALILVNWENKSLWKNISIQEVNEIQEKFEENVKSSLNLEVIPFKLIYEGELYNQA